MEVNVDSMYLTNSKRSTKRSSSIVFHMYPSRHLPAQS